jgi:hypothetical protein
MVKSTLKSANAKPDQPRPRPTFRTLLLPLDNRSRDLDAAGDALDLAAQ